MSSYSYSKASPTHNTNALLFGTQWVAGATVSYNFAGSASYYASGYSPNYEPAGFMVAEAGLQANIRSILTDQYAAVSNLNFAEVAATDVSDITIAKTTSERTAHTYYPGSLAANGDIWFGNTYNYATAKIGSYEYRSTMHELGHSLGLKHGHEASYYTADVLTTDHDSMEFSVMTYRSYVGGAAQYTSSQWSFSQTLMMEDIAAIQHLYGANFNDQAGNSVYTFNTSTGEMKINGVSEGVPGGNVIFRTVWDGNGVDTYDLSNYRTNLSLDLTPGGWSNFGTQLAWLDGTGTHKAQGNVYNAHLYNGDVRSLIENANGGAANDTIKGNDANNNLQGNGGRDALYGGAGNDTLFGGAGNDKLYGGAGNDVFYGGAYGDIVYLNTADMLAFQRDIFADFQTGDKIYVQSGNNLNFAALGANVDISTNDYILTVNNATLAQVQASVVFF
jgi:serralysin